MPVGNPQLVVLAVCDVWNGLANNPAESQWCMCLACHECFNVLRWKLPLYKGFSSLWFVLLNVIKKKLVVLLQPKNFTSRPRKTKIINFRFVLVLLTKISLLVGSSA